ncbi:AAA family ATPase [Pseudomonas fluorescens]|uniref:AAA family ATPase n=1 Tax=Pseudomonas fluorescens TaxID=294 RepID=UPI0012416928|nr:AAA family ATPase [Pseudomonas fluorescens]
MNLNLYAPLNDLKLCFASDVAWAAFAQGAPAPCAIHFVVGLNGSGKSHLLRALASIFVTLSDGRLPGFPFSLIYELGTTDNPRTVIFNSPGTRTETSVWQSEGFVFDKDINAADFDEAITALHTGERKDFIARVAPGNYPQAVTDLLPKVLAYTSGSWDTWNEVWRPPLDLAGQDFRFSEDEDFPFELERPVGWTEQDEDALDNTENRPELGATLPHTYVDASDLLNRPILLSGSRPDAALLVVALQGLQAEREHGSAPAELTDLFQKAGWQSLVSVRLRLNLDRALIAPRAMQYKIHDALLAAGEVIAQPDPSDRLRVLHFDVGAPLPAPTGYHDERLASAMSQDEVLTLLLGEQNQSAFSRFNELSRWLAVGMIDGIEMSIRRSEKPESAGQTDIGIMSYADLSDGEQMVLRRWALFHLLAGQQDALLLLDEPETHFNDAWKREIVSIIEQAMGKDASSVLIASHSAIVLSDVFDEEIIHIKKAPDGTSSANQVASRTFGTDPSALMMSLFQTDDSIGMRAQSRIEAFVEYIRQQKPPTEQNIADLKVVISRLGTGFYRTELRTLLNKWEQNKDTNTLSQAIKNIESVKLKANLLALLQQGMPGNGDVDA